MKAMRVFNEVDTGSQKISTMGAGKEASHVFINDYKTNRNSVIVPIDALLAALEEDK
jgi:hypothetical protein